jgi:hypothetical protein
MQVKTLALPRQALNPELINLGDMQRVFCRQVKKAKFFLGS